MSKIPFNFTPVATYFRDNGWFENPKTRVFITWCFEQCAVFERIASHEGAQVNLKPYQFIFGRSMCAKETKLSEKSVRNQIKKLTLAGLLKKISTVKDNLFSVYEWVIEALKKGQPIHETKQQKRASQLKKGPAKGPANLGEETTKKGPAKGPHSRINIEVKESSSLPSSFDDDEKIVPIEQNLEEAESPQQIQSDFSVEDQLPNLKVPAAGGEGSDLERVRKWANSAKLRPSKLTELLSRYSPRQLIDHGRWCKENETGKIDNPVGFFISTLEEHYPLTEMG